MAELIGSPGKCEGGFPLLEEGDLKVATLETVEASAAGLFKWGRSLVAAFMGTIRVLPSEGEECALQKANEDSSLRGEGSIPCVKCRRRFWFRILQEPKGK